MAPVVNVGKELDKKYTWRLYRVAMEMPFFALGAT